MEANYYKGIQSIYFNNIISNIIKIGNLNIKNKIILDFGCGIKILSNKLPQKEIINYDINSNYTEHSDYKKLYFDIVVANHVLMYLDKREIIEFFTNIKKINNDCEIIIGIAKVNWLSKLAKYLLLNFNAHKNIISSYNTQLEIIKKYTKIISKKNIFFSTDIFYTKLK